MGAELFHAKKRKTRQRPISLRETLQPLREIFSYTLPYNLQNF